MTIINHSNYSVIYIFVKNLIDIIRVKQDSYFVQKKKYFQGLCIPAQDKLDGIIPIKIDYDKHPSDQEDSWFTFDSENYKTGVKFLTLVTLQVYESPKGWGWILRFEIWKDGLDPDKYENKGNHWVYQHNEGPQVRTNIWDDWYIETDPLPGEG